MDIIQCAFTTLCGGLCQTAPCSSQLLVLNFYSISITSCKAVTVAYQIFQEPKREKAKRLGAQQVMFWELLQKFRHPKDILAFPRLAGLLLGSGLELVEGH